MNAHKLPPIELLRRLFHYNPLTGQITYLVQRGPRKPGDPAGCTQSGIPYIWADGAHHRADSIAWALLHGCDPSPQHVCCRDGNLVNLRADNLALRDSPPVYRSPRGRRSRRPGWQRRDLRRQPDGTWVALFDGMVIGEFATRPEALAARRAFTANDLDSDSEESDGDDA